MGNISVSGEKGSGYRYRVWNRLLLLIVITAITVVCNAQFAGGTGTEADPFLIETAEHFNNIRNYLGSTHRDKFFSQTADVSLESFSKQQGRGWNPIGNSSSNSFQGDYNGNGFIIERLYINRPSSSTSGVGLFGIIVSARITNLGVYATSVAGDYYTGIIAGNSISSEITECYSVGSVSGARIVGNLVGFSDRSTIRDCYSVGVLVLKDLVFGGETVGGLIGVNSNGSIINCYAATQVTQVGDIEVGGLVGTSQGVVRNSFWDFDVSRQRESAGGTGRNTTQMINRANYVDWDFDSIWEMNDDFSYPYFRRQASPKPHNIPVPRSLEGNTESGNLRLTWQPPPMERQPLGYNVYRDEIKLNRELITELHFLDGNLTDWASHTYYVTGVYEELETSQSNLLAYIHTVYAGGSGTAEDPWQVASAEQLNSVRLFLRGHFLQTADIDLNTFPFNQGNGWQPIASGSNESFSGSYDGNGFIISNLMILDSSSSGLFGKVSNANLTSISLHDVYIRGSGGTLASSVVMSTLTDSYATGNIESANSNVGGLIALSSDTHITNCRTDVKISCLQNRWLTNTGGLVGRSHRDTITNCYASGDISGNQSTQSVAIGGLLGRLTGGIVSGSYATGNVSGCKSVGGFVGLAENGIISDSYATGKIKGHESIGGFIGRNEVDIIRCYSLGEVTGFTDTGGFVGTNLGMVSRSYWNIDTSGMTASAAGTGLSNDQMINPEQFTDWDFADTWTIIPNISYPLLRWQEEPCAHNTIKLTRTSVQTTADDQMVVLNWLTSGIPDRFNIYRNNVLIAAVRYPTTGYPDQNAPQQVNLNYYITCVYTYDDREIESPPSDNTVVRLWGSFPDGDGSEENPYEVNSAGLLNMIRYYPDAHFLQTADIDLGGYPWNEESGWTPIGSSMEQPFTGSYDGSTFIVSGLTINRPGSDNQALFGFTSGAVLKNIGLVNVTISGRSRVAGVLSNANDETRIENCFVTGNIRGMNYVGGILGVAFYSRGTVIQYCYSTAILDITASGNIHIGGIAAYTDGHLVGNYVASIIKTGTNLGNVGSIVGYYAQGHGIAAYNYWNNDVTGQSTGNSLIGHSRNTVEMVHQNSFIGYDFDNVWRIDEGTSYPYLSWEGFEARQHNLPLLPPENFEVRSVNGIAYLNWQPPIDNVIIPCGYNVYRDNVRINGDPIQETSFQDMNIANWHSYSYRVSSVYEGMESSYHPGKSLYIVGFENGTGTVEDPYLVATVEHLWAIRFLLDNHFRQTDNISLNVFPWNSYAMWTPTGTQDKPFTGSYDGSFYSIRGLHLQGGDRAGFFGEANGARITGMRIVNAYIFAGTAVGGLVGRAADSHISQCHFDGDIYGNSSVGGIAGTLTRGSITESFTTGYVDSRNSTNSFIGGLVGISTGIIENSYSRMFVQGIQSRIGGLVGRNTNNITNSFSAGIVAATRAQPSLIGGLIGDFMQGEINSCYWDIEASRMDYSAGGEGRNTEQMTYLYAEDTYIDWDFDTIWKEDNLYLHNDGYPYLAWQINPRPYKALQPLPRDRAENVDLLLTGLSWKYRADPTFTNPVGFRVYLNTTGEFDENDDFAPVEYIEAEENYLCSDILPEQLEGLTTYYWKVVPTTNQPDNEGDAQNIPVWSFTTIDQTNVEASDELPLFTGLNRNYPNPFNPETTISFTLADAGHLTLKIYNSKGQLVRNLATGYYEIGRHHLIWDGRNENKRQVSSGIYFYRMETASYRETRKMLLLR